MSPERRELIRVSEDGRFLVRGGKAFFYLGDTVWELLHRYSRAEADIYLRDRAAKGFTVVQTVGLAELDGLHTPNSYGETPLVGDDPWHPNERYWEHVDWVVARANALGLTVGFLPTWGDKWNLKWGKGPVVFTDAERSQGFGEFIGERYKDADLIWILGGDRPFEGPIHRQVVDAMAHGLRKGDGGAHLCTFHPMGGQSSEPLKDSDWLDFHMWQSGHTRNTDNGVLIGKTRGLTPVKPCLDAEPCYEDHPSAFDPNNGYLDDYDIRKSFYWAVLSGACGHTYGCHPIWQKASVDFPGISWCRHLWEEALHLPGSGQMRHGKDLVLSRGFLTLIPDQSVLVSERGGGTHLAVSARGATRNYALVYVPSNHSVKVDLDAVSGRVKRLWWFDPRSGASDLIGEMEGGGQREFMPPQWGPDWVLVVDDAGAGFGLPGEGGL